MRAVLVELRRPRKSSSSPPPPPTLRVAVGNVKTDSDDSGLMVVDINGRLELLALAVCEALGDAMAAPTLAHPWAAAAFRNGFGSEPPFAKESKEMLPYPVRSCSAITADGLSSRRPLSELKPNIHSVESDFRSIVPPSQDWQLEPSKVSTRV